MSKLAVKQETALAPVHATPPTETSLNSDIIIPKLLLMQGLSEFVSKRKAQIGDIVRSTDVFKLGDPEVPVDIIPLTFSNQYRLEENINGKYEYRGHEPRTSKNEDAPWEFTQNGAEWKRTKVINLFALLPADIKAEEEEVARAKREEDMFDLNKALMPVAISFRSTSYNAGKAVVTHFAMARANAEYGALAHGYTLKLSCIEDKNDKGTFYVFGINKGARVSKESIAKAAKWISILTTQRVVVDESDEAVTSGNTANVSAPPSF